MIHNGTLAKQMRHINKLDINVSKLNQITEELNNFFTIEKLEQIKQANRGIYQLLLWELFVYEYHKTYNPFDFISNDFLTNRYDKDDLDMIKYYCEIMNYLKHNLKIKFKFNKSFQFENLYGDLRNILIAEKTTFELIDGSDDHTRVARVYFETKEVYKV
jgi:hypothetical protein